MNLAAQLVAHLAQSGLTVSTAESCTGGLIAAAITDIAGASSVYEEGVITYSNHAKISYLMVQEETLEAFGAVSEETAREMVDGLVARTNADVGISVTGIAGPGGSEFKPEGRVCFGVARAGRPTQTSMVDFGALGRAEVRRAATHHALTLIAQAVELPS